MWLEARASRIEVHFAYIIYVMTAIKPEYLGPLLSHHCVSNVSITALHHQTRYCVSLTLLSTTRHVTNTALHHQTRNCASLTLLSTIRYINRTGSCDGRVPSGPTTCQDGDRLLRVQLLQRDPVDHGHVIG